LKVMVVCFGQKQTSPPAESMYRLTVEKPAAIESGKPFKVKGMLTNVSKRAWQISHGADMFNYTLYDSDGAAIPRKENTILVESTGIGTTNRTRLQNL